MGVAITLEQYLSSNKIDYDLVKHHHTDTAFNSAMSAHLPSDQVSKAVILRDNEGHHLMAVVPANTRVLLQEINRIMGKTFYLVPEPELKKLFADCETGAIPCIGDAYRMRTLIDDKLLNKDRVFIEAGDHEHLIKLNRAQFTDIMHDTPHEQISAPLTMPRPDANIHQQAWELD